MSSERICPPSISAPAHTFGAIILAAGASSRLGEPKQLLRFEGRPLLVRAIEATLASGAAPIVVVLGAHAEKIRPVLHGLPILIADNPAWAEGMSSSLRVGLNALEAAAPALDAALIALCDQPHFSAAAIARLHTALTHPHSIAATRHGERAGVPAIFSRQHFPELHALRGDQGARTVIAAHLAHTSCLEMPELAWDIDTPADRARLQSG
jgi:molybdenum cofactor cytidylyltransferase